MSIELQTEPEVSIIPKNLSERDKAIIYTLVKEKALVKFQEKYISDMKMKNQEIARLNKKLQKKVCIDPEYLSTKDAALFIGVHESFLTKRQGSVFKLGVHFFKPQGETIVRWSLKALEEWIKAEHIDYELAELLERR